MRSQGQIFLGSALVLIGLVFLFGTLFHIDVSAFCFPVGLILLGAWLLARPRMLAPGVRSSFVLLGDISRRGVWQPANEEILIGIGDVDLDFTQAEVPMGETTIRIYGLVGEVRVTVPQGIGVMVNSNGLLTDAKLFGKPQTSFVAPVETTNGDFATAERRVRIETFFFVVDLHAN